MNSRLFVILIGLGSLPLGGCLTYYPNLIKTPSLKHAGEGHVGGYITNNAFDAYAAYAVSGDVATILSGSVGYDNHDRQTSAHLFVEGGVGTFGKPSPRITSEAFAGFGFGETSTVSADSAVFSENGNYMRLYVASDATYNLGAMDIGIATRIVAVDFVTGRQSLGGGSDFGVFLEPAPFWRFGWERLKFESQIGTSFHILSHPGFGTEKFFFGAGVHFILPELVH